MNARVLRTLLVVTMMAGAIGLAACADTTNDTADTADDSIEASIGAGGEGDELTIAIAGMVTPEEGFEYYQELSEYVTAKVGKKAHLIHKSDYATVNELLRTRDVDIAFVCSGPYVTAHDEYSLELLVAPVVSGKQTYESLIIVPTGSDATDLKSLKGTTFAYTDPQSNTGRIVPEYLITQMGEDPKTFFSKTIFTYSHDNSIKAVAEGTVDAAAVDSLIYDYQKTLDPEMVGKTRILLRSDPYGIPPVVVHPNMPEELKTQLRDVFLGLDEDPKGAAILKKMNIERFDTIENSAYDSIREMNAWLEKQSE